MHGALSTLFIKHQVFHVAACPLTSTPSAQSKPTVEQTKPPYPRPLALTQAPSTFPTRHSSRLPCGKDSQDANSFPDDASSPIRWSDDKTSRLPSSHRCSAERFRPPLLNPRPRKPLVRQGRTPTRADGGVSRSWCRRRMAEP